MGSRRNGNPGHLMVDDTQGKGIKRPSTKNVHGQNPNMQQMNQNYRVGAPSAQGNGAISMSSANL
jgi:hypothetical protein